MTINLQSGHRQRLRERFLKDMGSSMPDYELLELLLTLALPRRDVKDLAKTLINKFGSLSGVINATPQSLMQVSGVKETTISAIKIVQAASQRSMWQKLSDDNNNVLTNWDSLIDYCIATMRHNEVEEFRVIFLDATGKIIGQETLQKGTIDAVYIYPREVVNVVLANKAKSVVLVHNHPSGNLKPSGADTQMTQEIIKALSSIDVIVWDHLIVSDNGYFSFKEKGLLGYM